MNEIPVITDPLGKGWNQPERSKISLYGNEAIMDEKTFNELATYSCSLPSATYEGKMWKRRITDDLWYLAWYYNLPDRTDRIGIEWRTILIKGAVDISTAGLEKWRNDMFRVIEVWVLSAKMQILCDRWNDEGLQRAMKYGVYTYNSHHGIH